MPIRAATHVVLNHVRDRLQMEVSAAAGNRVLSPTDEHALPDGIAKDAAIEARGAAPPGADLTTDAVTSAAAAKIAALLGQVNQPAGPGAAAVSRSEVRALAAIHPDAGRRVAHAYELITGKHIDVGGAVPQPAPIDVRSALHELNSGIARLVVQCAGGNTVLSAAERAAMPAGLLHDAAAAEAAAGGLVMTMAVMGRIAATIEPHLVQAGIDMATYSGSDRAVPYLQANLERLVAIHPEAAGLFADALAFILVQRPDVPGLPPQRFGRT